MSEDFNKIMTLLLVEEKSRNFPQLNAIHAEAMEELSKVAVKLAEKQKKEYEEEQKKQADEAAAEAARKRKEEEDAAERDKGKEDEPERIGRRY